MAKDPNMLVTPQPKADGMIDDFIGLLVGESKKVATLEEIEEAAAAGWAEANWLRVDAHRNEMTAPDQAESAR